MLILFSVTLIPLSVCCGVRPLLPECYAVLQLLRQSDCRPAEETSQPKPVSSSVLTLFPTILLTGEVAHCYGSEFLLACVHYTDVAEPNFVSN